MLVPAKTLHTKLRKSKVGESLVGVSSVLRYCDVAHHNDAVMPATVRSGL